MGHGKESPRQKMIGMMYLVLTALLALNVSAEVLNAFTLVDTSLRKTAINFSAKTQSIYNNFESAMADPKQKLKVEPYKKKADNVKKVADELIVYIEALKDELVSRVDGPENLYLKEGRNPMKIAGKADNNVPSEIMLLNGKGKELQGKIEAFRQSMIELALNTSKDTSATSGLRRALEKSLNTDKIKGSEGNDKDWDFANFSGMPLAGACTMLSKFQTDIRNAEADVATFLWSQIDAASWKFNKIEAIVQPNSSYILNGGRYEAKIFIAASDSTTDPEIMVGGQPLKVENGKGIYTTTANGVGTRTISGVIKMKTPSGDMKDFHFKSEYQVGEPALVVSPTKMNVFYIGVANPVDISVSGVPEEQVKATLQGSGSLTRGAKGWVVKVRKPGKVFINAVAEIDGQTKQMGKKEFRVKRVPDPVPAVGGNEGGAIRKGVAMAATSVQAIMKNFDFDVRYTVVGFSVTTIIKGFEVEEKTRGARFTAKQKGLMKQVRQNQKFRVEEIRAKGPDGSVRKLPSLTFKVNG